MPKEKAMESIENLEREREREGNFIALLSGLRLALGHCAVHSKRSPLLKSRNAVIDMFQQLVAVIALLLHGRMENWMRNPQYVLEA